MGQMNACFNLIISVKCWAGSCVAILLWFILHIGPVFVSWAGLSEEKNNRTKNKIVKSVEGYVWADA